MCVLVFLIYFYETVFEIMYHHTQTFLARVCNTLYHKLLGAFLSLKLGSLISMPCNFPQIHKALFAISLNSVKNRVRRDPGYFLITWKNYLGSEIWETFGDNY